MWTTDDTVRRAVLHRLDMLDRAAGQADATTLLPLARRELQRLADGWRLLLTTHCAEPDGSCLGCQQGRRSRRWPCQVWKSAHEQLIGEGLSHRARTYPLRNPFRTSRQAR
jgi:predicted kinase